MPRSQGLGLRLADNGGLHLGRAHINAEFAAKQQPCRGGELGLRLEDLGRLLFQNKRARNKNPQKMCALVHQPGVQGEGGIWLIGLEEELLLQGVQLAELLAYHPEVFNQAFANRLQEIKLNGLVILRNQTKALQSPPLLKFFYKHENGRV